MYTELSDLHFEMEGALVSVVHSWQGPDSGRNEEIAPQQDVEESLQIVTDQSC